MPPGSAARIRIAPWCLGAVARMPRTIGLPDAAARRRGRTSQELALFAPDSLRKLPSTSTLEPFQMSAHNTPAAVDEFVPDPVVAAELGVSLMTVWRYDRDDEMRKLGWPAKISMRKRNFRSRRELEKFKAAMIKRAVAERSRS
jgi:hypothetical protein